MMRRFDLCDLYAVPGCNSGDEPMHLSVEIHVLYHLAPICLQGTSVVMEFHACHPAYELVGDDRREPPRKKRVFSAFPPPAHDIVVFNRLKKAGNVAGVVLEVAVKGDNHVSQRVVEPGGKGSGLPEVPP